MESWKSLLIVFALVALFSFVFISGIYLLQFNNGVNNTIFNNSALSIFNTNVISSINTISSNSNTFSGQIQNESKIQTNPQGALTLATIFHSITTFLPFLYNFVVAFFTTMQIELGISPIISTVMIAILIIVIILLFWQTYKWGKA
jgi:hypothetical protein